MIQRSVDSEANIIFGSVVDENMGDEISITVIATGFEKEQNITSLGVQNIVDRAWDKKINQTPQTTENPDNLDIPAFLRKNRGTSSK